MTAKTKKAAARKKTAQKKETAQSAKNKAAAKTKTAAKKTASAKKSAGAYQGDSYQSDRMQGGYYEGNRYAPQGAYAESDDMRRGYRQEYMRDAQYDRSPQADNRYDGRGMNRDMERMDRGMRGGAPYGDDMPQYGERGYQGDARDRDFDMRNRPSYDRSEDEDQRRVYGRSPRDQWLDDREYNYNPYGRSGAHQARDRYEDAPPRRRYRDDR